MQTGRDYKHFHCKVRRFSTKISFEPILANNFLCEDFLLYGNSVMHILQNLTIMQRFVCLFVCSLYKLAPLRGTPWNMTCPLSGDRAVLLGDRRVTIYLSCGRKNSPRYFRLGDLETPFYFLTSCGFPQHFGLHNILQRWSREHLGLAECFTQVDAL